jgi:hypothetical protein
MGSTSRTGTGWHAFGPFFSWSRALRLLTCQIYPSNYYLNFCPTCNDHVTTNLIAQKVFIFFFFPDAIFAPHVS